MNNKEINIPSLLKIGSGKIAKIGKYLIDRNFTQIALFFSDGIENLVADKLYPNLEKYNIKVVHKDSIADINIETAIHTAFKIPSTTKVLLGIGGGKALDYGKYCAHILKLPYITVPTSVSNDGFCSPNTSLLVAGKRKSVKSTIPYGVVADIETIETAPKSSLYSGIGDTISKITALWDWKQSFLKGYEYFNDFAGLMAHNSLDIVYLCNNLKTEDHEFKYRMVNSLVLSGIAMEIAGSSRPASGSEHLISHALDVVLTNHKQHGLQVGIATYLCSFLQNNRHQQVKDFLLKTGFFNFVSQDPINKQEFIKALELAPSIKQNYYTILSEQNSFNKAINFIETDDILKHIIK